MERAMLMPNELRATAPLRSDRGTSSGVIACQAGVARAAPTPPRNVRRTRPSTETVPVHARKASRELTIPSPIWMAMRKRRRSRMSDRTPAGMARRKIGSVPAAWIMATAAGEAEISVTSQDEATSRMKVPMLPSTVAVQTTAKTR
jgi:hypothetical protein